MSEPTKPSTAVRFPVTCRRSALVSLEHDDDCSLTSAERR